MPPTRSKSSAHRMRGFFGTGDWRPAKFSRPRPRRAIPCYWIYWEVGQVLERMGSPEPLFQRWIRTYATEEFAVSRSSLWTNCLGCRNRSGSSLWIGFVCSSRILEQNLRRADLPGGITIARDSPVIIVVFDRRSIMGPPILARRRCYKNRQSDFLKGILWPTPDYLRPASAG
jgi:hypothetical protein